MGDYEALRGAVRKNTRIILTESPTNPYLNIADFAKLAQIKKAVGGDVLLIIDSTFGTPYNQRPLKWRCDLVFHSATKYLAGHNDILAGAVIGSSRLIDKIKIFQGATGGIIAPHCAYLLLRGLKTFPMRIKRQNESALKIAGWLEKKSDVVGRVYYPGLKSHHDYELAKLQMKGCGGVVSFVIDRPLCRVKRFLNELRLCAIAPSLGGVETLITHPASVSYSAYAPRERRKLGIVDGLIRLSVGLEDPQDIIDDLKRGLDTVR
jgi:cystathionine gamma-synthase